MKMPGPDHPIAIEPNPKRVRISVDGITIAETTRALSLKEASYPAVAYIPRDDVQMALLTRTDRRTHCPYKGDASYYSIHANGRSIDNAIWTYEQPYDSVKQIADHLAFYYDKVTIEELA